MQQNYQNQISQCTIYNRTPKIFKEIKRIIPLPSQILSFGCSTGEECETLQELYFPNIKIIGVDIDKNIIEENIKKNKYINIKYYSEVNNITKKSDIIFANSVLCKWPENKIHQPNNYTFETFEKTLELIDSLLNKDGYLCIYNSKYLFCESNVFFNKKYKKINTFSNNKEINFPLGKFKKISGFVTKYHKNGKKINDIYPFFLFQKTME